MTVESEILSKDELVDLTGSKQSSAQMRWLDANEINYLINGKGAPVVGRHYLRARLSGEDDTTPGAKKDHQFKFGLVKK